MNVPVIKELILKDLYLQRRILLAYTAAALAALVIAVWAGPTFRGFGVSLFVAVVMAMGIGLMFGTVTNERKENTLAFVMSLPISFTDYTIAKIIGNTTAYAVPWAVLFVAAVYTVMQFDFLPDGFIPLMSIMLVFMLVFYFFLLFIALVSESEGWMIFAMVVGFQVTGLFFSLVKDIEGIAEFSSGEVVVWSPEVFSVISAEVAFILLLVALTFHLQKRKTDFM